MQKAVIYARVSSRDQAEEGYSLDYQTRMAREYAERRSFKIVKEFAVPESANGRQERKVFREMMDYVKKNKIPIIICEKVDRISRNFKEALLIDDWRLENETNQIHFWKENLIIKKDSKSHEIMQWDFRIVMAKQYSLNLSEEAKKGLLEKALSGWYPGSHKRGYILITPEDSKRSIWVLDKTNESEAPFIKKAFELYANTDWSLKKLKEEMFNEGWKLKNGKPIPKATLDRILNDPFYCGKYKWKEKIYNKGKHESIISEELFEVVQQKLCRKCNSKYRQHNHLFKGMIKCGECGCSITSELQKGHTYYRCTHFKPCNQRKYVREEEIEKQILDCFDEISIKDKETLELITESLRESHAEEITYHNQILSSLNKRYQTLQNRLDTLYIDKLDGRITLEKYEQLEVQFRKEQEEARQELAKHENANINYFELGANLLELSTKAKEIYLKRHLPEDKRRLLNLIFLNLTIRDGFVFKTYKKPFQIISERVKTNTVRGRRDLNP